MKLLLTLIGGLGIFSAGAFAAEVIPGDGYKSYWVVNFDAESPIAVSFERDFETMDSCNTFGLDGDLRTVQLSTGVSSSLVQTFMADFHVYGTELGCAPLKEPRIISFKTEAFEIAPVNGVIYAKVLVPENMELKVELSK